MRIGVVILPEERWWSGEPKWRGAEELGFDHAWTYDHLAGPRTEGPWFSAIPTLTAAAAITSSIGLGTLVSTPDYRHPAPFAAELLTLDDISDGRVLCGLGAGGLGPGGLGAGELGPGEGDDDRSVLGAESLSPDARAERFAEFVEALDGLLALDQFSYDGSHFTAREARNAPGCVQQPRPPFVLAAEDDQSMRLAARFGQGWVSSGRPSAELDSWWRSVAELAGQFRRALDEAGRDQRAVRKFLSLDDAPVYSLSSVDTFTAAAGRAHELGFTDVLVHWPRSTEPYAGAERVLERVAEEVFEEVRNL